jgi:hypothetical protein
MSVCVNADASESPSGAVEPGAEFFNEAGAQHLAPTLPLGPKNLFDEMTADDLAQWCPDQNNHAQLLENLTVKDVRCRFGVDPLLWHCYMCLIGFAQPQDVLASAARQHTDFWGPVTAYEQEAVLRPDDPTLFAPGPHIIVEMLARPQSVGS